MDPLSLHKTWIEAEGREEKAVTGPAGQGTDPYVGAYTLILSVLSRMLRARGGT
jgi:hypothetical protein